MREGFDRLDADFKSFETILREEIRMSDKKILSALAGHEHHVHSHHVPVALVLPGVNSTS